MLEGSIIHSRLQLTKKLDAERRKAEEQMDLVPSGTVKWWAWYAVWCEYTRLTLALWRMLV